MQPGDSAQVWERLKNLLYFPGAAKRKNTWPKAGRMPRGLHWMHHDPVTVTALSPQRGIPGTYHGFVVVQTVLCPRESNSEVQDTRQVYGPLGQTRCCRRGEEGRGGGALWCVPVAVHVCRRASGRGLVAD